MFARFFPYLGIVLALLVAALAASATRVTVAEYPAREPSATSTLSVVPSLEPIPLSLGDLFPEKTPGAPAPLPAAAPPTQKPKTAPAPAPAPLPAPAQPAAAAPASDTMPAPTPSSGDAALDASAASLRAALVNIICEAPAGGKIHSISGSGVVVTPSGFILTNAHIAQYFLLADRGVSCEIRAGSPASDRYRARLAYLPASWIRANTALITQAAPAGNGEHDYALLAITSGAAGSALPASFESTPLGDGSAAVGETVVIGSYGAQFLSSSQVFSSLFPTLVFGSIKAVYTFQTNTVDVVALGGSAAAQEGSSGGGVVNAQGALIATIVTSTIEGDTASRNVNAITASYIRADYASEAGAPLGALLAEDPARAADAFAPLLPQLESFLTAALNEN